MNNNIVEEIKSRCNIVDVIGKYVTLKRAGNNHKGVCPFHNEKTPSFVVSEHKQIFTCFGCGATGDVIEFVKRIDNLDFQGATEKLAKEYGIDTSKSGFANDGYKSQLYEINRIAARFYYDSFTKQANPGYEYMVKRGIDVPTLKKFGIGYADEKWDSLYLHLKEKGIPEKQMLELGLISQSKGKYYDKFRDRVMFPIFNTRGKVIGFGGRILKEGNPKYLNSQESLIFLKKNNLYGLNLARQDINKNNCAILVEGYMDVISLYKAGIQNTVASLGTSLTESQGKMLKRYTNQVIIAYDADDAGQAAAVRGIEILQSINCQGKVLTLKDGKDPDEFIKKYGKSEFMECVRQAQPYAEYMINTIKKKHSIGTVEGNINFVREVKTILQKLSPVEADVYIKKISSDLKISEGAIRMELNESQLTDTIKKENSNPKVLKETKTKESNVPFKDRQVEALERNLIKLMVVRSDYIPEIRKYEDIFIHSEYRNIFKSICREYRDDDEIDINLVKDSLDEEETRRLEEIVENVQFMGNEDKVFKDCKNKILFNQLKMRQEEILNVISILNEETDKDEISKLTLELIQIQAEIQKAKIKDGV